MKNKIKYEINWEELSDYWNYHMDRITPYTSEFNDND